MIYGKVTDQKKVNTVTIAKIEEYQKNKTVLDAKKIGSLHDQSIQEALKEKDYYSMNISMQRIEKAVNFAQEYLSDSEIALQICVDDGYTPTLAYVDEMNYSTLYTENKKAYATLSFLYSVYERGTFAKDSLKSLLTVSDDKNFLVVTEAAKKEFSIRKSIRTEKERIKSSSIEELERMVLDSKFMKAAANLIYHTQPKEFPEKIDKIVGRFESIYKELPEDKKENVLKFVVKILLDVKSFLIEWNLKNREFHDDNILSESQISKISESLFLAVEKLEGLDPNASAHLREKYLEESTLRLKAEGCSPEEAKNEVEKLVGKSLIDYISNMTSNISKSNLTKISNFRKDKVVPTELGNDYAAFLEYTMWVGVSFVTSNPVLIDTAWKIAPEYWTKKTKEVISHYYTIDRLKEIVSTKDIGEYRREIEKMSMIITMEVVYENAMLLRDIFLITEGKTGQVSLQINPKISSDAKALTDMALFIWEELSKKMGGVPNVVFKLPATSAGLEAAKTLTQLGIGVNITVNFGLFQELMFADVLNKGAEIASYLTVMNGRLVGPVAEELKDSPSSEESTRWAGIAVVKDLHSKLYGKKQTGGQEFDPARIKVLVASLRIYPELIPDITECVGTAIITIFPNVRRAFDLKQQVIQPKEIEKQIDRSILEKLAESETFKQAYYTPEKAEIFRPKHTLNLGDNTSVLSWIPVARTLKQFGEAFDNLTANIEALVKTITNQ